MIIIKKYYIIYIETREKDFCKAKMPKKFRKQGKAVTYLIFYKKYVIIYIEIKGKINPLSG